jgi:hypothetical protein
MSLIKITLILLLFTICLSFSDKGQLLAQQSIPRDTKITLKRTECFGTCPNYTLTISGDGTVTFEGRQFVKKTGIFKSSISIKKVQQLIAEFNKANYFSLKDKYLSNEDGCPQLWTDQP